MMKRILLFVVLFVLMVPAAAALSDSPDDKAAYRLLSSGFIPNIGQYDPDVEYVLQYQGTTAFFTGDGLVLTHTTEDAENASTDIVRQSFAGASLEAHITAHEQRSGVVNYYVGNDSSKWLSGIPVYSEIVYEDLYPGIDLVYTEKDARLKREFHVAPGADPSRIELSYEGESRPHVDEDGVLRFASPAGEMLESPLVCWQVIGTERVTRDAEYVIDEGSVCIDVVDYDAGYELIIDPELVYSSYLGGGGIDAYEALEGDGAGGVWVMGITLSTDFPVKNAYQSTYSRGGDWDADAFVSHFSPSGTFLSSTYLGGGGDDLGQALAGDGAGGVWVTGFTYSDDFPVLNAHQNIYGGSYDAFISHFSPSGTLLSSTYLGGGDDDGGYALAGDGAGGVWVTGVTSSDDFPVLDAYQNTIGRDWDADAFVSHFSSSGTLLSSTYLGGEGGDCGYALASDGAGGVWVMGEVWSLDFPVLNAYQNNYGGDRDIFVAHFSSPGILLSSTYLGGGGDDYRYAFVSDSVGGVWVTGSTDSDDFPVLNACRSTYGGNCDAFISHFSSSGVLTSSTYLGGGVMTADMPSQVTALVGSGSRAVHNLPTSQSRTHTRAV